MSASDVIHETILKAHKNREQFRGRTEAEYRAWLRRILANIIADAAQGREADILQALDRSSAVLEEWVVAEGPSPAERLEWTCRPLSRTGVFPFCRSSAPAPVTS